MQFKMKMKRKCNVRAGSHSPSPGLQQESPTGHQVQPEWEEAASGMGKGGGVWKMSSISSSGRSGSDVVGREQGR
jgi:hypothetical protein